MLTNFKKNIFIYLFFLFCILKVNADVIVLNGKTCSGKSSIAKIFRDKGWTVFSIDDCFFSDSELFSEINKMHRNAHDADWSGKDVLIDHCFLRKDFFTDFLDVFSFGVKTRLFLIKVSCSYETAELRFKKRNQSESNKRVEGTLWFHYGKKLNYLKRPIHENLLYDFVIKTDNLTPEECEKEILNNTSCFKMRSAFICLLRMNEACF